MNREHNNKSKEKTFNKNKLVNKGLTSLKRRAIAIGYIFDFNIFR